MMNFRKQSANKLLLLGTVCLAMLACGNPKQHAQQKADLHEGIQDSTLFRLEKLLAEKQIPAIQVSYSKPRKEQNYYIGFKKQGEPTIINSKTAFQAASLTKVVMAYTFFRLMDQGLIQLDEPLWNYYPYDRLKANPNREKITARMVLTHRTGLLNWEGDVPSDSWRQTPLTSQFEAGTDYMYSGEGFYFLQETLEHISGKSFQQLVEEEVLQPFGMRNSEILWKDRLKANAAFGHYESGEPRKLGTYRKTNAAYTLYTTAIDYRRFLQQAILEGKGLHKETHQLMLRKASEAKKSAGISPDDQYVPCALGLRMQLNEVGTAYWHTGSNPGFRCFFVVYPESQEILCMFSNSDNGFEAIPEILALFLNNNQRFWLYDWRQGELD